ncbi:predicted protein [Histoplasma mississippiense (nom. inval.)]|uniref:predicted protein n=1 Tax=Ajellomyces capsulatus (strain NAm1 / WU24) TaxID=2059318 RepID=UPI000157C37E|nr:predicted protein [Histoplasma mississippiense (nom. inval.)]EDN07476.1 predicted protein [Histoplasma mississippiense (nom. inval.)]
MDAGKPVTQEQQKIPHPLQCLTSPDLDVIPERVLNEATRGPLKSFIQHADSLLSIIPIWKCLFRTFSSNDLSSSHMVAICNAISAFLDATTLSINAQIREFTLSESKPPWTCTFEFFLDRYERKPKPMRLVLTSLIRIASRHRDDSIIQSSPTSSYVNPGQGSRLA